MIPKKLHTVWIGNVKPNVDLTSQWNVFDGWEVTHWSDPMIEKHFGDDEFLQMLYKEAGPTKISDYVRLLILQRYGGVYSDKDVVFLRPIDRFLRKKAILSYQFPKIKEPKEFLPRGLKLRDFFKHKKSLLHYYNVDIYLNNSILASMPNGDMINTYINVFKEDYLKPENERFSYTDYGCGPAMTTYVGNLFCELNGSTQHTDAVSIYDYRHFHPCNYLDNIKGLATRDFTANMEKQIEKGKRLDSFCVHIQSSAEADVYSEEENYLS